VPGQPVHEATRKVVLAGADGVVFVADSRPDHRDANRASWASLAANLAALGLDQLPIVVQYNKRDLPDCLPLAELDRFDDPARAITEATAKTGGGVLDTFFRVVDVVWDRVDRDLKLSARLNVDSAAFRRAVAEHVRGGTLPT
jgi:hypothetical protein